MSYILEALKKSQQERELGQVPTLDAGGLFTEDRALPSSNHWGLLAVGLASLAVVIALYAAFRAPAPSGAVPADPSVSGRASDSLSESLGPAVGDGERSFPETGLAPASPAPVPLVEAPGPKRSVREARSSGGAGYGSPDDSVHIDEYADESVDAGLEEALQRQLEAETYLEPEPAPPPRSRHPSVPQDLVQDIEAFKQQVRREQGIPPPTPRRAAARIPEDATGLRLTAKQQAMIPAYLMTAHVYDKDPAKRFVVINALKYREGEQTREGFWVERIDPEGAVLSYMGNLFFVAR
ncbi:general secretion pathway protein GspB [Imhoffiella purpurea]|uniref:Type II secretion system protein GspB C-terminal domain-containing protein n=1 Tax=Imhoffiella purpurea TaxID=1249627 RepID=W9VU48_9GAMM|nr:general secretion pathway protein GspB [Imhoffiella purpurea]EXJ13875.1 hypothetical protein D779_3238 [Imhoffiella purpurea]